MSTMMPTCVAFFFFLDENLIQQGLAS